MSDNLRTAREASQKKMYTGNPKIMIGWSTYPYPEKRNDEVVPKACLVVSSGYSNDPIMSNYQEYGFSGVISKPYNIHNFNALLNSLFTH